MIFKEKMPRENKGQSDLSSNILEPFYIHFTNRKHMSVNCRLEFLLREQN